MKKTVVIAGFLFLWVASSQAQTRVPLQTQSPQPSFRCTDHVIQVLISSSGEQVEGPSCVEITINALRYNADFGEKVELSPGPAIPTNFPLPTATVTSTPPPIPPQRRESPRILEDSQKVEYRERYQRISESFSEVQNANKEAITIVDDCLSRLKSLVINSDGVLSSGSAQDVLNLIDNSRIKDQMDNALKQQDKWRKTDDLINKIQELQADINGSSSNLPDMFKLQQSQLTMWLNDSRFAHFFRGFQEFISH